MPLPPIRPKRYRVEYDDGTNDRDSVETFDVRVTTVDILDTELLAPTFGLRPSDHSIAVVVMWTYHAAKRAGLIAEGTSWPEYRRRCVDWWDLDKVAEGEEAPEVPPTPDSSESSSGVPPTDSAVSTSTSGSTPPAPTNVY